MSNNNTSQTENPHIGTAEQWEQTLGMFGYSGTGKSTTIFSKPTHMTPMFLCLQCKGKYTKTECMNLYDADCGMDVFWCPKCHSEDRFSDLSEEEYFDVMDEVRDDGVDKVFKLTH